jgi:hypothetical protein
MVWPTGGSQISTAIRSALSRSLVALIAIQSQKTSVSVSKSPGLNRIGEAPGTLIISHLLRLLCFPSRTALCKNGHFYSAAGSFGANEWRMDLARQSVALPSELNASRAGGRLRRGAARRQPKLLSDWCWLSLVRAPPESDQLKC